MASIILPGNALRRVREARRKAALQRDKHEISNLNAQITYLQNIIFEWESWYSVCFCSNDVEVDASSAERSGEVAGIDRLLAAVSEETSSVVSGVSDIADNLQEIEALDDLEETLQERAESIEKLFDFEEDSRLHEDGRAKILQQEVSQYQVELEDWTFNAFNAEYLDGDYPWLKLRDHDQHHTELLSHRHDSLLYCAELSQRNCTLYWPKGVRGIVQSKIRDGLQKVAECDCFIRTLVAKLQSMEVEPYLSEDADESAFYVASIRPYGASHGDFRQCPTSLWDNLYKPFDWKQQEYAKLVVQRIDYMCQFVEMAALADPLRSMVLQCARKSLGWMKVPRSECECTDKVNEIDRLMTAIQLKSHTG